MMWMRETRINLFMQMELEACRNELNRLIRCHDCIVNNCPEKYYTLMPLLTPFGYAKNLARRAEMAKKGISPPTFKMILRKYYPLPVRQSPVLTHSEIPSCSPSLTCTEPESWEDGQTDSDALAAQAGGRKEEQLETSLAVQPDDMTGKHRDGGQIPLEQEKFLEEEGKVVS